jgi:hypothetical protein
MGADEPRLRHPMFYTWDKKIPHFWGLFNRSNFNALYETSPDWSNHKFGPSGI